MDDTGACIQIDDTCFKYIGTRFLNLLFGTLNHVTVFNLLLTVRRFRMNAVSLFRTCISLTSCRPFSTLISCSCGSSCFGRLSFTSVIEQICRNVDILCNSMHTHWITCVKYIHFPIKTFTKTDKQLKTIWFHGFNKI